MKLLYLSCHAILEYDELKLFEELGAEYFSLGSYLDPQKPVDSIRPPLTRQVDPALYKQSPDRNHIPKAFFDQFDVIIIMHIPEWIYDNWENMKHKRVIWRTIGQSSPEHEQRMKQYKAEGMQIVRYSPRESRITNYAGQDAMIRFYKDPDEFTNWNGKKKEVVTIAQNMKTRGEFCNYETFLKIIDGYPAKLYGTNNEESGELNGGFLPYEDMKQVYRDNAVYLYTGTQPASYTLNFIEAWMTGIPIIAIGSKLGSSLQIAGDTYEIPDLFGSDQQAGVYHDDIQALRHYVEFFLINPDLGRKMGVNGRNRAIELFGKETIRAQWKNFLNI